VNDVLSQDVFARLVEEDEGWLREQWEGIMAELRVLDREQRELKLRRERLEARRAVLDGIAQLRQVELSASERAEEVSTEIRSPKAVALQIMQESDAEWSAPELHRRLQDEGIVTSRSNVRMVLRRLVEEGALRHVARGRYRADPRYRSAV
jgi:glutamate-1-semialdehyde aminotransferase